MPICASHVVARIPVRPMASMACCLAVAIGLLWAAAAVAADQIVIPGPPGSGTFGMSVTVLPNGNFVVVDPAYDAGSGKIDVGAVYLYDGRTRGLISMVTGNYAGDQFGSGGIYVLNNGNFVVATPTASYLNSDGGVDTLFSDAGMVTWIDGTSGHSGSLFGDSKNDRIGAGGIITLTNSNFVVVSPEWDNGAVMNAGAVSWGNGALLESAIVSATNSLVGSSTFDGVGSGGVSALANGNYVVLSPNWHNGAATAAGAITWGSGSTGIRGAIAAGNSMIGPRSNCLVGSGGITRLANGNYVVASPAWDDIAAKDAGAATWGSGTSALTGFLSSANSLVGSKAYDAIALGGITALRNGNYVVLSPNWTNGAAPLAGAATLGSGTMGAVGEVTMLNSLVGGKSGDRVGSGGAQALTNGNYVVLSSSWDNGVMANAGAATWGHGLLGVQGTTSPDNSLVGSKANDTVGVDGATVLPNGNYVVVSSAWDNGLAVNAGAVTWGNGAIGATGPVTVANSLAGRLNSDGVGAGGVTALPNGNFVVASPNWDNDAAANAGAVTWGNGTSGVTGTVSMTNSVVGTHNDDQAGSSGVVLLTNGNYLVRSPLWNNGATLRAGAVTWASGTTGLAGAITPGNSLVGSTAGDQVGSETVTALANDNYVVASSFWDNGGAVDAGAVTWGSGTTGITGSVTATNSLVGALASQRIGNEGVIALADGDYLAVSTRWGDGAVGNAGAVTWGNGMTGSNGPVVAANSLVGTATNDYVGAGQRTALPDGDYFVVSPYWANGTLVNAGAVTLGSGTGGTVGPVTADNSARGTVALGGVHIATAHDAVHGALVVGLPSENIVRVLGTNVDTTVRVTSSPNPSIVGESVTLAAIVAPEPPGPGAPQGEVTFALDGATVGTAQLDSSGLARVQVSDLTIGNHLITAQYVGGNGFNASPAPATPHVVERVPDPVYVPLPALDLAVAVAGRGIEMHVLDNDADPSGTGLFVAGVGEPAHGTATIDVGGQFVAYTSVPVFSGLDYFTYTVQDGAGKQATGRVMIMVTDEDTPDDLPQIARVEPGQASTLTFTDTRSLLTLNVPAGVFTGTLEEQESFYLLYTTILSPTSNISQKPFNLTHAGFTFRLDAYDNGILLTNFEAARPMTLTIVYDASLLAGMKEETLNMYSWTGVSWHPWGTTLVNRDTTNHTITFQITHLGESALFAGSTATQITLPLVIRGAGTGAADVNSDSVTVQAAEPAPGVLEAVTRLYLPAIQQQGQR